MTLPELLEEVADLPEFINVDVTSVHVRGMSLCTPLHCVAQWGNNEAVKLLLDNGADINAKDEKDYTPIHWAIVNGTLDTVSLLRDRGADLSAVTAFGETAADMLEKRRSKSVDENEKEI
jgi:ankyrin repeat protein